MLVRGARPCVQNADDRDASVAGEARIRVLLRMEADSSPPEGQKVFSPSAVRSIDKFHFFFSTIFFCHRYLILSLTSIDRKKTTPAGSGGNNVCPFFTFH